jgi:hypothetical protein
MKMTAKLTLSISKETITHAKRFAKRNKTSISALVENYLRHLIEAKYGHDNTVTPMVKELTGIIKLPNESDHKKEYEEYLAEKYK